MSDGASLTIALGGLDEAQVLSGAHDQHLRRVRERFGVDIILRDLKVVVSGGETGRAQAAAQALERLLEVVRRSGELPPEAVEAALGPAPTAAPAGAAGPAGAPGERPTTIEGVRLRTAGQLRYVSAIAEHDVVFSIGPAGTGKTFLAVLMAVQALKRGEAQRLVLCRPAVEAGESLGFLPGDFQAKVNPYMRPLYDALYSVLGFETVKKYMEREVVEVAPLAYMRGRTLNDAFVILDEAQNTTRSQMKMFLTRMGERSKIVVTGDVTQVDLPRGVTSGLIHAQAILRRVDGIAFVELNHKDIVRHRLVWKILEAYEGSPTDREASEAGGSRKGKRRR